MFFISLIISFMYFTAIEGSCYEYHPEIRGSLKLHAKPADWQTARMNCHDEDALLAAPWSEVFLSTLVKMLHSEENELPSAIFVGIHANFPEGVFKYKNGMPVISQDPSDVEEQILDLCAVYYANGTGALVDCRLRFAYVCHVPTPPSSSCVDSLGYKMDERTGQWYKFHPQAVVWDEARQICQDEQAHLAIINSNVEATVLRDIYNKYPQEKIIGSDYGVISLGFYYWKNVDTFLTIQGQTLKQAGYEKWAAGEPTNRGKSLEPRGAMLPSGLFDNIRRSLKVAFICEKKPIKLQAAEVF